jgi:hypothetical protein
MDVRPHKALAARKVPDPGSEAETVTRYTPQPSLSIYCLLPSLYIPCYSSLPSSHLWSPTCAAATGSPASEPTYPSCVLI